MFALTFQHIVEDEVAQKPGLLRTAQFDILDFAINVALFAGQEKVAIAAAVDECFPLQPLKTGFDDFFAVRGGLRRSDQGTG